MNINKVNNWIKLENKKKRKNLDKFWQWKNYIFKNIQTHWGKRSMHASFMHKKQFIKMTREVLGYFFQGQVYFRWVHLK